MYRHPSLCNNAPAGTRDLLPSESHSPPLIDVVVGPSALVKDATADRWVFPSAFGMAPRFLSSWCIEGVGR